MTLIIKNKKAANHLAISALVLVMLFVATSFILVDTQSGDLTVSTMVANSDPEINSVYVSDAEYGLVDDYPTGVIDTLIGGSSKGININGIASDPNGEDDLSSAEIVFYRTNHVDGYSCAADENDCYRVSCLYNLTYGDELQASFNCPLRLKYFADATDAAADTFSETNWTVYVKIEDDGGAYDENISLTKEVASFISVGMPGVINFGSKTLGQKTNSDDNVRFDVEQYGNMRSDLEVHGTDLNCTTSGKVPIENIKWSKVDEGFDYIGAMNMTTEATDTDFNLGLRSSDTVTKPLFWNIMIPDDGLGGTCAGSTVVSAKAAD